MMTFAGLPTGCPIIEYKILGLDNITPHTDFLPTPIASN